ncbi:hypothetical protein [Pedobacter immunditicola]|uniref:hypothetical protein n=1 Tax=Pedobacter immunditicola TaxID=3133440 RepID=UPI003099C6E8
MKKNKTIKIVKDLTKLDVETIWSNNFLPDLKEISDRLIQKGINIMMETEENISYVFEYDLLDSEFNGGDELYLIPDGELKATLEEATENIRLIILNKR